MKRIMMIGMIMCAFGCATGQQGNRLVPIDGVELQGFDEIGSIADIDSVVKRVIGAIPDGAKEMLAERAEEKGVPKEVTLRLLSELETKGLLGALEALAGGEYGDLLADYMSDNLATPAPGLMVTAITPAISPSGASTEVVGICTVIVTDADSVTVSGYGQMGLTVQKSVGVTIQR